MMNMDKILWILTGGTFSCSDTKKGLSPAAGKAAAEKIRSAEDLNCDISCLMNIDSSDISPDDIENIARSVHNAYLNGYQGIVITHGTDTLAYTAAYLDFMLENIDIPVVITGSQRPYSDKTGDASANLQLAFEICSREFRGVFVAFGGKVFKGSTVYKAHSTAPEAFCGEAAAFVGKNGELFYTEKAVTVNGKYRYNTVTRSNIGIISISPFTTSADIARFRGYDGLVIAAYGLGGVPHRLHDDIKGLCDSGTDVMIVSQCREGGVSPDVYEVGESLKSTGAVFGGKMTVSGAAAYLAVSRA